MVSQPHKPCFALFGRLFIAALFVAILCTTRPIPLRAATPEAVLQTLQVEGLLPTVPPATLTADEYPLLPRPAARDAFGYTIVLDGDTAVVAATLDDEWSTDSGAIYIFRYNGTNWVQEMKWVGGEGTTNRTEDHDQFGYSVAIDGDTVVAGAPYHPTGDYGAAYVFFRNGSVWTEQTILLASDQNGGDQFGASVDVSGDTLLVGAPMNDDGGSNSGAVYVFTRTGTTWTEQTKLIASDDAAGDEFGHAVSLEGDTALIGAWRDDDGGSNTGSVYVFTRTAGVWTQQTKLNAADRVAADNFGNAISLDGNTAVIGKSGDDGPNNSGAGYIFVGSGSSWGQQAKLKAADATGFDQFGTTVSVSGDRVVVGAYGDDTAAGANAGSAYIFERSGVIWTQQIKLAPTDPAAADEFGTGVAVSGTLVIVGAPNGDEDNGTDSGAAYVFSGSGASWVEQGKLRGLNLQPYDNYGTGVAVDGDVAVATLPYDNDDYEETGAMFVFERVGGVWQQVAKLRGIDTEYQDEFGCATAVDDQTIAVGARRAQTGNASGAFSGAVYIFVRSSGAWVEQAKITPSDASGGDIFGCGLVLVGDTLVVSSAQDDDMGSNAGAVYVFQRTAGVWTQQTKLLASDGAANDQFGSKVALSEDGHTIAVGVPFEDGVGVDSGAVYIYQESAGVWSQQAKITAVDGAGTDQFGVGVGLTGEMLLVGSPRDDDSFNNSGSVYVFTRTGTSWAQTAKLHASDAGNGDQFGQAVAVSGATLVAAATSDDDGGTNAGAVYVWQLSGTGWLQQLKIVPGDAEANAQFGTAVSVSADRIAVGTPSRDSVGTNAGAAYVYEFAAADTAVYKSDTPDPVMVNTTLTYVITATNAGPTLATNVVLTDTLPASVTFNSASTTQGSCGAGNPVVCLLGDVGVGSVVTVTIQVTPTLTGTIVNTAEIVSDLFDYNTPNNSDSESTIVTDLPNHVYAAPDVPTCAGNTPCFTGPGNVQQALNGVADDGQVTILGLNIVNAALQTGNGGNNNVWIDGSGTVSWAGGSGSLFSVSASDVEIEGVTLLCSVVCSGSVAVTAGVGSQVMMTNGQVNGFETAVSLSGTVTARGNSFTNLTTVFNQSAGSLLAYANNITSFTLGVSQTGGSLNVRHNWWGDGVTAVQIGNNDGYDFRLGASVAGWGEGVLGAASLTTVSGTGTGVIVSHGRGESNAPFHKATSADGNSQCSDYYDFFVVGGSGNWTLTLPIDNIVACDTTYNNHKLFVFALTGSGAPDTSCTPDTACWNLLAGVSTAPSGHALQVSLDAIAYLRGTPFVAGNDSGEDPTAVHISTLTARTAPLDGFAVGVALLVIITGLVWRKKRTG